MGIDGPAEFLRPAAASTAIIVLRKRKAFITFKTNKWRFECKIIMKILKNNYIFVTIRLLVSQTSVYVLE